MLFQKAKWKKGAVHKAVVVRTRKEIYRDDGSKVQFDKNAVVLTDDKGEPIGTRIFWSSNKRIKIKRTYKIISLARRCYKMFLKKAIKLKLFLEKIGVKQGNFRNR